MKNTFKILKFSYPYFGLIILNTVFNVLSVIFSLFSISLIIPILGLLFGTIEASANPVNDLSINNLKDFFYNYIASLVAEKGIVAALGFICGLVAGGTILKNISRYLALCCLTPIRNNVIRDIRKKMYDQLLNRPLNFINKFKKGDIVSRITNDLIEIEWSIMGVLELFIKEPIHIIVFLISLTYISPELTLISLIFLPITGFIITKLSSALKRNSLLSQNKIAELISIIEEAITNLKIIKAFNANEFSSKNFDSNNEELKNINNKMLWRKDLASPMSEMLSTLVMVIIIWFGGKIVLTDNLDADSFIGFLVIFSQILPPAKSLTTAFYSIQKGSAAAERVLVLLSDKEPAEKKSKKLIRQFNNEITFNEINFKYQETSTLKNINLKIKKGQKIAIVGESGSGKSTLIELLLQFHHPSSGYINIDDNNISNHKTKSLFGLVTQNVMLFNDTIMNNLMMANNNASKQEIEQACKDAHIHNIIADLENGYDTIIGPKGTDLSGGEKQRISIARALISRSQILIFDEPTSSLDADSHTHIQKVLMSLTSSKTLITITHKLSAIQNYDNIIVMKKGEVIEQGKHQFLIEKNGVYKKLYEIETLKSSNEEN